MKRQLVTETVDSAFTTSAPPKEADTFVNSTESIVACFTNDWITIPLPDGIPTLRKLQCHPRCPLSQANCRPHSRATATVVAYQRASYGVVQYLKALACTSMQIEP